MLIDGGMLSTCTDWLGPAGEAGLPLELGAGPGVSEIEMKPSPAKPVSRTMRVSVVAPFKTLMVEAVAEPVRVRLTSAGASVIVVAFRYETTKSTGPVLVMDGTGVPIAAAGYELLMVAA